MLDTNQAGSEPQTAWDISTECSGFANALAILTKHADVENPTQRGAILTVLWELKRRAASLLSAVEAHQKRKDTVQSASQLFGLVDAAIGYDAGTEREGLTTMRSLASLAVDVTDKLMSDLDDPQEA